MRRLEETLAGLSPGVASFTPGTGAYSPRKGLAIYFLPCDGAPLTAPGSVLGEALAGRSGLGCTMLEGVPAVLPAGAVLAALYEDLQRLRPDLTADLPVPTRPDEYVINIGSNAVIVAKNRDGLVFGLQTMAMLVMRHADVAIPGVVIQDYPECQRRGIAVELRPGEIGPGLVYQIVSFVTTFKANALDWILPADFSSSPLPDLSQVIQVTKSLGVTVTVRLPLLGCILSGEMGLRNAWTQIRTIARAFGATRAALDDPCPDEFSAGAAGRLAASVFDGEFGLDQLEVDAGFIERGGLAEAVRGNSALVGWRRMNGTEQPEASAASLPLRLEVAGSFAGLSSYSLDAFSASLDSACGWLERRETKDIFVSFRDVGVSHAWQNLLPAAAIGVIIAWGVPSRAKAAARAFTELLYGESAPDILDLWSVQDRVFPPGIAAAGERRLREIAYGVWPDAQQDAELLAGIEWQEVVQNINLTAGKLENVASGLTRNKTTLAGSYLSLQLLAWLCRFSILMPEITRRRRENYDGDGRTEPIANELMKSFGEWRDYLLRLQEESGLKVVEMDQIIAMGLRVKGLVDGIFE
ncbi:MAG: glycoside hydrolase family 20 zincin-like fold domain-containing protein [Planctomycetota bacterium]|jgi:hypothetical protein|nr:glycoside hydrolase family 20 zincin-like fold domain-containing protein [Planctomycetota bacterium]